MYIDYDNLFWKMCNLLTHLVYHYEKKKKKKFILCKIHVHLKKQEAFEKMLGQFATASRRYIANHQVSLVARQL